MICGLRMRGEANPNTVANNNTRRRTRADAPPQPANHWRHTTTNFKRLINHFLCFLKHFFAGRVRAVEVARCAAGGIRTCSAGFRDVESWYLKNSRIKN